MGRGAPQAPRVPGALILLTQIVWIPFWAAGVINGIGHYWGYRHCPTPDASTNIVLRAEPLGDAATVSALPLALASFVASLVIFPLPWGAS